MFLTDEAEVAQHLQGQACTLRAKQNVHSSLYSVLWEAPDR